MTLRQILLPSILIALLSLGMLAVLVIYIPPTLPTVALALLLVTLAIAAVTAPILGRIQQRIAPPSRADELPRLAIRQGLWAGLYVATLLILRLLHLLDPIFALVLLALFILIENFLQTRASWQQTSPKPKKRPPGSASATPRTRRSASSFQRTASSARKQSKRSAKPQKAHTKTSKKK